MKYSYSVHFHGEISSTPEEAATEGIAQIHEVVKNSFKQDLQAGVVLNGMSVHVDILHESQPSATDLVHAPSQP